MRLHQPDEMKDEPWISMKYFLTWQHPVWLQNTLNSSWIHSNLSETFLPLITAPKDLYYTINHPFQGDATQAAHTAAELLATLGQFLCCLPFQASLSQPFHQLFHHRFCINPAALHKQPGFWLRKKQSSEKCSRTRTSQEFWKSVFTKLTNTIHGVFILSSEKTHGQCWKKCILLSLLHSELY